MRSTAVVVSVAVLALPGVAAQEAASPSTGQPRLEFEVASVRPNTNPTSMGLNQPPGRFMASGLPLQLILTLALRDPSQPQVQPQIEGMPGWASTERFDISAKMPDGAPPEQMPAMLRSLLDDRFALRTHLETREEAIYELVVAREDGRLGRQMTRTTVDCGPIRERRAAAVKEAMGRGGSGREEALRALVLGGPGEKPLCTMNTNMQPTRGGSAAMTLRGSGVTLQALAALVRSVAGRKVVDRTGLAGEFDIELTFSPQSALAALPIGGAPPTGAAPAIGAVGGGGLFGFAGAPSVAGGPVLDDAPTIGAAVKDQLGLELRNARGPVEYIVVDHLERPEPD